LLADGQRATRSAVDYFTTSGIADTQATAPIWSAFFPNGGAWSVLRRAGGESRQEGARSRSRDGLANLPGRCGRSLREADANAYPFSGRKGHCVERSLSKLRCHARTGDAIRGLLRGADADKLGSWLDDARHSGIHALQQFARTLARDFDAVRNAIAEPWSSG
jgi:hypothetical protein